MQTLERLGAEHLTAVITTYRDVLRSHQERINRLNVYPVPDGDTGTNMALTVDSVVGELEACDDQMPAACRALSHRSVIGARGHAGGILSQILPCVAKACEQVERH